MGSVYDQISASVRRLYEAKQERDRVNKFYEEVRKKEQIAISNFMFSNLGENNSFDITLDEEPNYYTNHKHLGITRVRTKKIIWDIKKLKKQMPKQKLKKILNKTYTVSDMSGLVEYLKSCGVDPKKFKKYIIVEEEVDNKAVDNLSETGEITREDIKGCYKVELSEPYIRITEKENYVS